MRVFMTGATGLIGRALTLRLRRDGHTVVAWSRSAARVAARLGGEAEAASAAEGEDLEDALARAVSGCDAVVALAGEPVLPGRWTAGKKRRLRASRVDLNQTLCRALDRAERAPSVVVAASAVGFYGDTGVHTVDEQSPAGTDYLGELCQAWEAAFDGARAAGRRVCHLRIGIVLARGGGALGPMLPLWKAGLGGPMGSGTQGLPWVHAEDLVEMLATAVVDARYSGPINGVGPRSVSQAEFSAALGRAVGRPAVLPAPAFAMRLLLGEAADALLGGQYVRPARLDSLGFTHRFTDLDAALTDVVGADPHTRLVAAAPVLSSDVAHGYLSARRPTHELRGEVVVPLEIDACWRFFADPRNLGALTPADMAMDLDPTLPAPEDMGARTRFTHHVNLGPVRLPWAGEVVAWEPPHRFVDVQHEGPYRCWWHEHRLEAVELPDGTAGTRLIDRVRFASPLGPIGRLATWVFVAPTMQRLFAFRTHALRARFGVAQPGGAHTASSPDPSRVSA